MLCSCLLYWLAFGPSYGQAFGMKTLVLNLILAFFVSPISFAADSLGTIKALKGTAEVVKGKNKTPLKKGDAVKDGDLVATGKKSALVIQLKDESVIKLGSRSRLRIKPPRSQSGLELVLGEMFSKVRKAATDKDGPKGTFKVRTKSAVAGVRGTEFYTSYGKKENPDDIWLCVNEGEVEVTKLKGKKAVTVKAGEGISVTAKKGISDPKPLAWTKKLNWNMDPEKELENTVDIESAYTDLLDQDYD